MVLDIFWVGRLLRARAGAIFALYMVFATQPKSLIRVHIPINLGTVAYFKDDEHAHCAIELFEELLLFEEEAGRGGMDHARAAAQALRAVRNCPILLKSAY